ncbi:MAG: glycosyltransferase [Pyrinomonadaceae bacterium]
MKAGVKLSERPWWKPWRPVCPVISTKSGGPQDIIVDGETGWLVEPVGWEPLTQALRELYVDAGRRKLTDKRDCSALGRCSMTS